jgi:hypothetical protein
MNRKSSGRTSENSIPMISGVESRHLYAVYWMGIMVVILLLILEHHLLLPLIYQ